MAGKKKGPGKGRGPANRPPSPSKRTTTPKPAAAATGNAGPRGGPTREERLAAAEAGRRRQRIRSRALNAGLVVAVMAVVAFVISSDRKQRNEEAAGVETGSCRFDRRSDPDSAPPRNHVPNPRFEVNPPGGGDHTPQAAAPGVYTPENTPVDGHIVHAMEHGYVVLWHRLDLDEPNLVAFRQLAQKYQPNVLLVPRPSIGTPVAATAWHARLGCGALEIDTVERFITTFLDKGPESGFITDRTPRVPR